MPGRVGRDAPTQKTKRLREMAHDLLDEAFDDAEREGLYGEFGVVGRFDGGEAIRVRQVKQPEYK